MLYHNVSHERFLLLESLTFLIIQIFHKEMIKLDTTIEIDALLSVYISII